MAEGMICKSLIPNFIQARN